MSTERTDLIELSRSERNGRAPVTRKHEGVVDFAPLAYLFCRTFSSSKLAHAQWCSQLMKPLQRWLCNTLSSISRWLVDLTEHGDDSKCNRIFGNDITSTCANPSGLLPSAMPIEQTVSSSSKPLDCCNRPSSAYPNMLLCIQQQQPPKSYPLPPFSSWK